MSANKRLSENSAMTNEQIIDLLEDVINQHCHYGTDMYNQCDKEPCQWCIEAKGAIEQLRTQQGGEVVAWWNGDSRFTRHDKLPKDHYWETVIPLYTHPPAPAVPEGYVMVPVEPTDEMLDAMAYAKRDMEQMQVWDARAAMTEVYQAMLKSQGGE